MFPIEYVIVPAGTEIQDCRSPAMGLIESGMDLIGDGLYSRVYSSDKHDFVIKVTKGIDKGYWHFINAVRMLGEGNPYLPRIHKVVAFKENGFDNILCYATFMEKLKPTKKRTSWADAGTSGDMAAKAVRNAVSNAKHCNDWPVRKDKRDLIALLLIARDQYDASWFDFHQGNVMLRGRQLVITDPIACG